MNNGRLDPKSLIPLPIECSAEDPCELCGSPGPCRRGPSGDVGCANLGFARAGYSLLGRRDGLWVHVRQASEEAAKVAAEILPPRQKPKSKRSTTKPGGARRVPVERDGERPKCKSELVIHLIEDEYGAPNETGKPRLRYNRMSRRAELDGSDVGFDRLYIQMIRQHHLEVRKEFAVDVAFAIAQENTYSPVAEYLEECHRQHGGEAVDALNSLASTLMGSPDPMHNAFLKLTLIGAVARALSPGCQMDSVLLLHGDQGMNKSRFFRVMAGDWFDDSLGSMTDKDERLKLYSAWIVEWGEVESVFRRKDISAVKAFITCQRDNLRVPYGRHVEPFPRHSIIVGTTNDDSFLADDTGNRRYWVVPVQQKIDLDWLKANRDRLWAAAVELFRRGEPWFLPEEDERRNNALNRSYEVYDPWDEAVGDFLESNPARLQWRSIDILIEALKMEPGRISKGDQQRMGRCLKRLGYQRLPRNGRWIWQKMEKFGEMVGSVGSEILESQTQSQTKPRSNPGEVVGSIELVGSESDLRPDPTPDPTLRPDPTPDPTLKSDPTSSIESDPASKACSVREVADPDPTDPTTSPNFPAKNVQNSSNTLGSSDSAFLVGDQVWAHFRSGPAMGKICKALPCHKICDHAQGLQDHFKVKFSKTSVVVCQHLLWSTLEALMAAQSPAPAPSLSARIPQVGEWVTLKGELPKWTLPEDRYEVCGVRGYRINLSKGGTGEQFDWHLSDVDQIFEEKVDAQ